jgi:hypothetical protein
MDAPLGLGPVRCRDCGATWHAVHIFWPRDECIRCGGGLVPAGEVPQQFAGEHEILARQLDPESTTAAEPPPG